MELPDFFGLDIGDHSIKIAQVRRKGDKAADLLNIASVSTTLGILDNDSEEGIEELAAYLKQAYQESGATTTNCVAAIPETPVFSRLISVPKVEEEKLSETVHWELKPLLPVPLDEVDVAFLEVGERDQGGQKLLDVYAVASPKRIVQKFKTVTEKAGLNLIALETESLSNTRLVSFNYENVSTAMVVDFGSHGTDVILSKEGVPVFAQTIGTGSDALTKAIAADYGITEPQAEQYKRAYGIRYDVGEGKIAKTLEPIMQLITDEMTRTLTYLRQKVGETEGARMYLVGEGSLLPGLPEYLTEKIGLETVLVNPTAQMNVTGGAKSKLEQLNALGFTVAIGLGLKDS